MPFFVAWLRGINVGAAGRGRKSVPMPELRALAVDLGWSDPRTHVQSGNLVFAAAGTAKAHTAALERAISERFGFEVPVIVSNARAIADALADCPFVDAADERPNLVHIGFANKKPRATLPAALARYCFAGERVAVVGPHLWIDLPNGVARSKVTPSVLDRSVGAPVTMRNVKTLRAVAAMLAEA